MEWPDGAKLVITGRWERQRDAAPLVYEGAADRLLALMPWRRRLPQTYDGRAYEGVWETIAAKAGLKVQTEENGEWVMAEL